MNGHVDGNGRALITVSVLSLNGAGPREIQAWIIGLMLGHDLRISYRSGEITID